MREHRYVNRLGARNRLNRLAWTLARAIFFRLTPPWAMHGWRRAVLRAFGARVGEGCRIDPSARIWLPSHLVLGEYVAIDEEVDLYCVATITIGSKVAVSRRAFLCTASHDITDLKRPLTHSPITIADHAWIAAEAMIFPGAQVGEGAVIAARAVLRGEAVPWAIYAGNPARRVGDRKLASAPVGKSSQSKLP